MSSIVSCLLRLYCKHGNCDICQNDVTLYEIVLYAVASMITVICITMVSQVVLHFITLFSFEGI